MSFLTQLNWRYALKKFDTTKKLTEEQLAQILTAIRMAPTAFGVQPFHVLVVTDPALRAKLREAGYGQPQITDASHLLVFCARTDLLERVDQYFQIASGGDTDVRAAMKGYEDMMTGSLGAIPEETKQWWAAKQAYIALGFGLAAAAELGIDAGPMEGFDPMKTKEILALPNNLYPHALVALGFRAEGEAAPAKVRFPESDLFEYRG